MDCALTISDRGIYKRIGLTLILFSFYLRALLQILLQIPSRVGSVVLGDLLGGAVHDELSSALATFGADIDDSRHT